MSLSATLFLVSSSSRFGSRLVGSFGGRLDNGLDRLGVVVTDEEVVSSVLLLSVHQTVELVDTRSAEAERYERHRTFGGKIGAY
jgi:hypothetical protein